MASLEQNADLESKPEPTPTAMPASLDDSIVDWDGNEDPENPMNWSSQKRLIHIALVSFITLVVNLAATLFAPAAGSLVAEFEVTDTTVASLTVSIYVLGFALGPLVLAPMSELYGRMWIYHICNVCFLAFTIGCAASPSIGPFLACRFLAGCAGAAPLAVGGGTIADITRIEQRGKAMAAFGLGPLLGPILGPVIGGFVAQDLGWRWALWIISIVSGISTVASALLMTETYAPAILRRKARRLRKETGNLELKPKFAATEKATTVFLKAIIRPTKMLFLQPIVSGFALYLGFIFGLLFLLFTTFPAVFQQQYGFTTGTSGLAYLGLGIGTISGLAVFGKFSDRIVVAKRKNSGPQPEHRLPLTMYTCLLVPIGIFWYGWTTEYKVHWIVPIIGTGFAGVGIFMVLMPCQLYAVDAFGASGAASALAALTVVRSLLAAFLPLAGPRLYENLGLGWGNSLLAFLAVAFAPVPYIFYRYGAYLRERFQVDL